MNERANHTNNEDNNLLDDDNIKSISLIFIPITYNCLLHVLFFTLSKRSITNQHRYQSQHRILVIIILRLARNRSYLGKITQHFKRQVQYISNTTITVGFISQIFRVTYYLVVML